MGGGFAFNGQAMRFATSADAVDAGIFLVPEDRKGAGLVLDFPIAQNITPAESAAYSPGLVSGEPNEHVRSRAAPTSTSARRRQPAHRSLSGGNQQKVVLAKWLR